VRNTRALSSIFPLSAPTSKHPITTLEISCRIHPVGSGAFKAVLCTDKGGALSRPLNTTNELADCQEAERAPLLPVLEKQPPRDPHTTQSFAFFCCPAAHFIGIALGNSIMLVVCSEM